MLCNYEIIVVFLMVLEGLTMFFGCCLLAMPKERTRALSWILVIEGFTIYLFLLTTGSTHFVLPSTLYFVGCACFGFVAGKLKWLGSDRNKRIPTEWQNAMDDARRMNGELDLRGSGK